MQGGVIQKIWKNILDYIFPQFCVACRSEGAVLCEKCLDTLEVPGVFCCPVCHAINSQGACCSVCVSLTTISQHIAMMPLSEKSLIHELIHLYKYQYIEQLEEIFSVLINRFFASHQLTADYLIPVPLHRKRYVERGFNQSERIARLVSKVTHIPFLDPLTRTVNTVKQATLDKKGREHNVKDAFMVVPKFETSIVGKKIVVIDDVYTTGSTLKECAGALIRAGAREVAGWSIARG